MPSPQDREAALFALAVEKPATERAGFLDAVCGADKSLRQRLAALFAAHEQPDEILGATVADPRAKGTIKLDLADDADDAVGQTLGRYKLLERVGEGGCGVVYVAEQTEPVRRRVALKVIKLGMDTKAVVARFEAERQALAMMDHPNIAKVLDAGTTDTGRPYFVMELVRGIRITEYCDQNNLSTNECLDLFIKVCQAIQHAHQKGIIHRDIKPSNILVTLHDGVPVPKVIDFGIAKATEGRLTDATVYTQLHQFIGTPAYMSPEQAEMSGLDIDTRSDIYSLGVLLYELLAGSTPFDAKELMASGIDAMRKTIREKEPVRPSTKLSQTLVAADVRRLKSPSSDTSSSEEEVRACSRRLLRIKETITLLRGDLDWIVMKALEKDRTRRYETANGLAADIKRHLNNEAVSARPQSSTYRFQKLVRRNKLAVGAGLAVAAALVLGVVASALQAVRATREKALALTEKRRADEEAAKQEAVNKFLNEMFASADPETLSAQDQAKGRNLTVVQVLDEAVKQLELGTLKERPEIEAAVRQTIGTTYESLGQFPTAERQLRRALELNKKVYGPVHLTVARTLNVLSRLLYFEDKLSEAEQLQRDELALQRKLHNGQEHPDVARALYDFAAVHLQQSLGFPRKLDDEKLKEGEAAFREALAMQRRVLPPKHRDLAKTLTSLARLLMFRNQIVEAERLVREALAMQKDLLGAEHPDVAVAMAQLGEVLQREKNFSESESLFRQTILLQRKVLGDDHHALGTSLCSLGDLLDSMNRSADAEAAFREALAIRRKALGEDNVHVAWCLRMLARNMVAQQRLPEAEQFCREALSGWLKCRGAGSDGYLETVLSLAAVLKSENKPAEIEALYREVLVTQRASLGNDSPAVAETLGTLAASLQSKGKQADAEKTFREAMDTILKLRDHDLAKLPPVVRQLAEALKLQSKSPEAEKLYEETINVARQAFGPSHPALGEMLHDFGEFLAHENKYEAAAEYYLKSLPIRRAQQNDDLAWTLRNLGDDLIQIGRSKEAEAYLRESLALHRKLHHQEDIYGTAWATERLAYALFHQQKLTEAEQAYHDALRAYAKCQAVGGDSYTATVRAFLELLYSENKLLEIESLLKDVLSQERQSLGERHGTVAVTLLDLASLLKFGNKPAEAAKCHREALEIASNLRADATNANLLNAMAWHLVTAENPTDGDAVVAVELAQKAVSATKRASTKMLDTLAAACAAAGQFTNAVRAQQEAIAILQDESKKKDYGFRLKLYESNSPYRDHFQVSNRTAALLAGGKFAEAEPLARECLALREKEIPDGWWTFNARSMLGGSLLGQKKYSEAEPLLLSGYEGLKQREDKISPAGKPRLRDTLQRLVQLYQATGRPDQAADWQKKLEQHNKEGTGKTAATLKGASE